MNNTTLTAGQFYGVTRVCRTIPGFKLMESAYPSGMKLPKHSHERASLSLMLDGAMVENYRTRTLEPNPQTVSFNAADEAHWNAISQNGARFLILEIAPDLTRPARPSTTLGKSDVFRGGDLNWLGLKLYRESLQDDEISALAIEGLALEMIAALCRMNTGRHLRKPPGWLTQAREMIHAQLAGSLTVSEIANTVGVHPVHLARTFRRYNGTSVGEYVRRLRIERVRDDIFSSDLSLAEIAQKSGFCDQGHLSRVFKRFTGMSPAKYRALFR